jgi:hypothetical protein
MDRGFRLPFLDRVPHRSYDVEVADTGGAFRPDWRKQDPSADPREPGAGDSTSVGTDHGWSNCTMASAALAYAYEIGKQSGPWGGDMRHNQDDLSGGTDLYDAQVAWERYGGKRLTIRSGAGWREVEEAHSEGRAILIQGEGNVPGSEAFDGGHACVIGCETHSDGRWLFGDPLASGWQWVTSSSIREWAQNLSTDIAFAVGKAGQAMTLQFDIIEDFAGTVEVKGSDHKYLNLVDGKLYPITGIKPAYCKIKVQKGTVLGDSDDRRIGYLIGTSCAMLLEVDVTPHPEAAGSYELVENLYIKKT